MVGGYYCWIDFWLFLVGVGVEFGVGGVGYWGYVGVFVSSGDGGLFDLWDWFGSDE